MNSIRVLLNAVKGRNIKVNITMNNGITYRCYVVGYINSERLCVRKKYKDYPLLDAEVEGKDYNTININYIGRVVIKASHVGK